MTCPCTPMQLFFVTWNSCACMYGHLRETCRLNKHFFFLSSETDQSGLPEFVGSTYVYSRQKGLLGPLWWNLRIPYPCRKTAYCARYRVGLKISSKGPVELSDIVSVGPGGFIPTAEGHHHHHHHNHPPS